MVGSLELRVKLVMLEYYKISHKWSKKLCNDLSLYNCREKDIEY